MTKDPNDNPNDMGGPSFHPQLDEKAKVKTQTEISEGKKGQILKDEQVPPL